MNQYKFAYLNTVDKIKKTYGNFAILNFYIRTYLFDILIKTDPDYFIVSYPKCGRTWLRIMLQKYMEKLDLIEKKTLNASLLHSKLNISIKFEHDQGTWVPAPPKIQNLKFNKKKYRGKKVIFLVRDPRDVIVSSWYHLRYREQIFDGELSSFIRDDLIGIKKIVSFYNLWQASIGHLDDFVLISYEDLASHTLKEFISVIKFLNLPVNRKVALQVVRQCGLENMKKMEMMGDLNEPWMKPGHKNDDKSMKIRRGKVGGYKDELTNEDIRHMDSVIENDLHPSFRYSKR